MSDIQVYGADWCEDTVRTRSHLESLGLPYDYLNVESNSDAKQWVIRQNDGKQKTPTVKVGSRIVLSEPSDAELDVALRKNGLIQ
jgi:mycoredoxin